MPFRRVGLIADTHGLLRPEAAEALEGTDLILHAGDIGGAGVLEGLRRIAPVVAVRGNNDTGPWASRLPDIREVDLGGGAVLRFRLPVSLARLHLGEGDWEAELVTLPV